ncbi:hypothetical protein MAR_019794, partial [Mya arenaria]
MSGASKGVATNISKKEPRALYTHCYGHALNLAVSDTVMRSRCSEIRLTQYTIQTTENATEIRTRNRPIRFSSYRKRPLPPYLQRGTRSCHGNHQRPLRTTRLHDIRHLEDMLLESVRGDASFRDDMEYIVNLYGCDLNRMRPLTQLEMLSVHLSESMKDSGIVTLQDIVSELRALASRELFTEVVTVVKLILVMPATNATSERSFSALRRVKTCLRTNMTLERLNHLMSLPTQRITSQTCALLIRRHEIIPDPKMPQGF